MDESEVSLSGSQGKIFKEFKENVSDIVKPHHTDSILLKFLKAKNFDLKCAERNFRQVDAGYKSFGSEIETFKFGEIEEKYGVESFFGFAKDRTVIRYLRFGALDLEGFILAQSQHRLTLVVAFVMENDITTLREESKKAGKEVNEITYIIDLEGGSIKQIAHKFAMELSMDFFHIFQEFYPNILRRVLVVNAPFHFDKIFNIFKPLLKATFLEKIQVIPKTSMKEILLKYIDEDVLPGFLGGKRVDSKGNPECTEFVKPGGKIPQEYYLTNRISLLQSSDLGVISRVIGPRSVYNHCLVASEAGGTLHFEYRTENGSIWFSLLYKDFSSNSEKPDIPSCDEILDESDEKSGVIRMGVSARSQSHLTPNIGKGHISSPGIYILRFDNTDSWFSSRNLILRTEIIPPQNKN